MHRGGVHVDSACPLCPQEAPGVPQAAGVWLASAVGRWIRLRSLLSHDAFLQLRCPTHLWTQPQGLDICSDTTMLCADTIVLCADTIVLCADTIMLCADICADTTVCQVEWGHKYVGFIVDVLYCSVDMLSV